MIGYTVTQEKDTNTQYISEFRVSLFGENFLGFDCFLLLTEKRMIFFFSLLDDKEDSVIRMTLHFEHQINCEAGKHGTKASSGLSLPCRLYRII